MDIDLDIDIYLNISYSFFGGLLLKGSGLTKCRRVGGQAVIYNLYPSVYIHTDRQTHTHTHSLSLSLLWQGPTSLCACARRAGRKWRYAETARATWFRLPTRGDSECDSDRERERERDWLASTALSRRSLLRDPCRAAWRGRRGEGGVARAGRCEL